MATVVTKITVCDSCGADITHLKAAFKLNSVPCSDNTKSFPNLRTIDLCPSCECKLARLIGGFLTPNKSKAPSLKSLIDELNTHLLQCGDIPVVSSSILPPTTQVTSDGIYSPNIFITSDPDSGEMVAVIYNARPVHRGINLSSRAP